MGAPKTPFRYRRLTPLKKKFSRLAVDFAVNKFMPRMYPYLIIRVDSIKGLYDEDHNMAWCRADWIDRHVYQAPRDFVIEIDHDLKGELFARTLFHELVHVKQYAKGEMQHLARESPSRLRWQGEMIDHDRVDYWDHPWEIEARGYEEGLIAQFCATHPEWTAKIDQIT